MLRHFYLILLISGLHILNQWDLILYINFNYNKENLGYCFNLTIPKLNHTFLNFTIKNISSIILINLMELIKFITPFYQIY